MKTYREIVKKIEDKVICDVCGQTCVHDYYGNEYATLEAIWSYASSKDGEKFDIQICENCFDDTIEWMKQKRQQHLGPLVYPHNKDPFNGDKYNTI